MASNTKMYEKHLHTLEFSDYKYSDAVNKTNDFQIKCSTKRRNLSIETLAREINRATFGKNQFVYQDKSI